MSEPSPTRRQRREASTGRRRSGLAQVESEEFSISEAIGGVRGAVETVVPSLLFVVVFTIVQELRPALVVSIGAAVVACLLRLVTRSSPMQAVSGVVGVVVCAIFADRTGEARDYYLPGFFINVGSTTLYLLSTVRFPAFRVPGTTWTVGPGPYPVIGVLVGLLTGEGLRWRDDPARMRMFRRATWMWAGLWVLRLVVQVPLYLADDVAALGVARLVMGMPAFVLLIWLTWLMVRATPLREDLQPTVSREPDPHEPDPAET